MYLTKYLEENENLYSENWPKFLKNRVNYAINNLSHKNPVQTIDIPSFLNELGLRELKDQAKVYRYLTKNNLFLNIDLKKLKSEFVSLPITDIASWIDSIALILGNYELLYDFVQYRYDEILSSNIYELLIFSGTVMSIFEDNRAIILFSQAGKSTHNTERQATALHRELVFRIKRMKEPKSISRKFDELFSKINEVNPAERLRLTALADNLYGLYIVKTNVDYKIKNSVANTVLENAQVLLKQYVSVESNTVKLDEAYRYLSQVNINQAQLLTDANHLEAAEKILIENLEVVSNSAHDYVPEARAALAYVYYLEQKLDLTIDSCQNAINEFDQIGLYESSDTIKQILVAAYYKANKIEEAEKVWKDIKDKFD